MGVDVLRKSRKHHTALENTPPSMGGLSAFLSPPS